MVYLGYSGNQRDRTVPPLRSIAEKWDGRPGNEIPTGRRRVNEHYFPPEDVQRPDLGHNLRD